MLGSFYAWYSRFKMERGIILYRWGKSYGARSIIIKTGVNVGMDISATELKDQFDAIVLTGGSIRSRGLP